MKSSYLLLADYYERGLKNVCKFILRNEIMQTGSFRNKYEFRGGKEIE